MKGERISGEKHSDSEEAKYKAVKKIYTYICRYKEKQKIKGLIQNF